MTEPAAGPSYTELIPRPDPSKLTDEAIARATAAYRRELDALRELLAERITTAITEREREISALRELLEARLTDMEKVSDRRFAQSADLPDQIRAERLSDLARLRELIEARLDGMDRATELVAAGVRTISGDIAEALAAGRAEFAAADVAIREAVHGQRELVEARLFAMDKATELLAAGLRAVPSTLEERVRGIRELLETRLFAMDKATELLAADLRAVPSNLDERVKGLRELIGERLDAMDRATDLRLKVADELPASVSDQIDQLRALHEERFSSIAGQFAERDVRTSQAQQASDQALNAALQAAKELVNAQGEASSAAAVKSETSFTKQIDQIGTIISTLEKALDARITELKERIDRGEGTQSGQASAVDAGRYDQTFDQTARLAIAAQQRALVSSVIAGVSVLVAIVSVLLVVLHK